MIRFSVGRSGKNIQTDVRVIQQLLNKIDILGTQMLTTDGVAGARTIDKIQMFQRTFEGEEFLCPMFGELHVDGNLLLLPQ